MWQFSSCVYSVWIWLYKQSSQHLHHQVFDDSPILGLKDTDIDISVYHLIVNIKKTEEIIFDPGQLGDHSLLQVHNDYITHVHSY